MADEIAKISCSNLLNNEDSQVVSKCDVNHESQQLPDEQLGASWFSPPITSTQIVSFDLLSLDEDDSQDEFIVNNEKQNILVDLSSDELMTTDEILQYTHPAYLLALSPLHNQTNVSETPPPGENGESLNRDDMNVTDYLFNNSKLINAESSINNISIPTIKAPSKRLSIQDKSKKPAKIKKPKIEGYSCKLNGTIYQVLRRDLDVLEAIEKGLKVIQEKVRQMGVCNVRSLCLQLNQIQTVLDILDENQLELEMPLEAWNEMMILTKAMFHDTQNEVDHCKKRRFELDTFTDELTTSFSHSFNISGSKQTKQKSSQQLVFHNRTDKNSEKNLVRTQDVSTDLFDSQILRSNTTVEVEQEENEILLIGAPHKSQNLITGESSQKTKTTERRGRPLKSKNKGSKKKSSDKPNAPVPLSGIFEERSQSILNQQTNTSTDNLRRPDKDLNMIAADPTFDIEPNISQRIPPNPPINLAIENSLETLSSTFCSTLDVNESLLQPQEDLQANDSQINIVRTTNNCINSSQQIEEETGIADKANVTDYQDETLINGDSLNSTPSLFRGKRSRLPKILTMNFNLRPFVLKGILSPGKNNMRMNINNRIYIASLAPDGTIEMNGFSFPTIGNWIKSVEGKRFGKLTRMVQKTLELQYSGKPLEEVLEEGEKLNRSLLRTNEEIARSNPALQATKTSNNISLEAVPVTQNTIPNPTPSTEDELTEKNPVPNNYLSLNANEDLQLVPDEMTRHIKTVFLHAQDEYFPICQCFEQFWSGAQPFPKHLLDEVESW